MLWLALLLLVLTALPVQPLSAGSEPGGGEDFAVFGYLPEYRLRGFDYESAFAMGLTHLIFFSLEVNEKSHRPAALDRLPTPRDALAARKAADRYGAKILLSFGGNARSKGFGEMTAKKSRRKAFLNALNDLLMLNSFDGVDYNWEYPANEQEWKNWGRLMRESKETLLGGDPSKNVVTFTMYLDPNHYKIIQTYDLLAHADYVHCMAYDSRGQHSTMEFAKSGIALAAQTGLNKTKWTLGVPFYGRNVVNREPVTYYDILPTVKDNRTDVVDSVFYNSQETIKQKTRLALDAGVGGVMIWELGQDKQPFTDERSLLSAINKALPPRSAMSTSQDAEL